MKKKVLFSIALAGLMLGSCSKDVIDNGGNGASWNENGEGYISLGLNLPTVNDGGRASRAEQEYPTFVDGESTEYSVRNATLILFVGADESAATINSAYEMNISDGANNTEDQITTTVKIVQKINEIELSGGNKIYALVVLNDNDLFTISEGSLKLNGDASTEYIGQTLATLNNGIANVSLSDNDKWNKSGFLMSNSPLFNKPGYNTNPNQDTQGKSATLTEIKTENIFSTYDEAWQNPAASIYVERAQAKIQVSYDTSEKQLEINYNGTTKVYTYKIIGWQLDNYNTNSYLTRDFDDTWAAYANNNIYRFVDERAVKSGVELYRTYWGQDVNYDGTESEPKKTLTTLAENTIPTCTLGDDDFDYCLENTTNLDKATPKNLTRIIVAAQLKEGDDYVDFFTVNEASSDIYLYDNATQAEGSIEYKIKTIVLGRSEVVDEINKYLQAGKTFGLGNLSVSFKNIGTSKVLDNANDIEVAVNNTGDIFDSTDFGTTIKAAIEEKIKSVLNENIYRFEYFKDGKCYYAAYIRHFNDTEAKWDKATDATLNDNKHLGRYGVLRNNWYVLNVNSIKNIGSSVVPELPENPIDEEEFYLSVEINILAWAKRTQDVDL